MASEHTLAVALEQIERFKARALATDDAGLRSWYIKAADAVIFDLAAAGVISVERSDEMGKAWAHRYAACLPGAPTIAGGSDARH